MHGFVSLFRARKNKFFYGEIQGGKQGASLYISRGKKRSPANSHSRDSPNVPTNFHAKSFKFFDRRKNSRFNGNFRWTRSSFSIYISSTARTVDFPVTFEFLRYKFRDVN